MFTARSAPPICELKPVTKGSLAPREASKASTKRKPGADAGLFSWRGETYFEANC
jgi:hypothetical protein